MTEPVERVDQSDMALSRRELMGSSAVVAAGAMGVGMVGTATAQDGPTDEISGTVTDTDGNAMDGATVVAVPHDSSLEALVTTTDANGAYSFQSGELHPNSNLYHVVARDGTESSPLRSQQNYPFIAAEGDTAIPDSGSLQARFAAKDESFSDGASVTTITDQTGNGHDLTGGSPSYETSVINSKPVFRFDGTDDSLDTSWSAISQPYTLFVVVADADTSSFGTVASSSQNTEVRIQAGNGSFYRISAGNRLDGGSNDGSFYILSVVFNGTSSFARQNGTQVISGDAGSNALDGFRIGANETNSFYLQGDVAEMLVYPDERTSSQISDVESYLSDEYGITV